MKFSRPHWPSRLDRRVAYLVVLIVGLALANLLWTSYAIHSNNQDWCDSLVLLTSSKPAPGQPAALKLWADFRELEQTFGCGL